MRTRVLPRDWILLAVVGCAVAAAALSPPIPQDPAYHEFAVRMTRFGIPNFQNVVSNVPFVLAGAWGWCVRHWLLPSVYRPAYALFCLGVALVGVGSSYYHLAPDNDTLVWDRLPMTVAFMALFAIVIGDRMSARLGCRLLWPLVVAGVASVLYWDWTEFRGRGDLRAYGLVQFLPMLLMPLLLSTGTGRGLRAGWLWATLFTYGVAKLAEHFDVAIYALTGVAGGHNLKHLLAALAVMLAMIAMTSIGKPRNAN